jgi:2-acylglycerol O-acyltransferase 2
MKHDVETLYLSKRIGFVKLALRHGAPLVPAFAFGQCNACVRPRHPALSVN